MARKTEALQQWRYNTTMEAFWHRVFDLNNQRWGVRKLTRFASFVLALLIASAASMAASDAWIEVRSPHFAIVSDAPASQARDIAQRFERVRAVFEKAFPTLRVYPNLPIIVLAARNEASFQALEPASWEKQGEIGHAGVMVRNADKVYILLRLDVAGENPYRVIYHEYAHLILESNFRSIPLWLNEGLAEFYGNSELDKKTVRLGLPSEKNLKLLRAHPLLPLSTLFTVTQSSPYYNEQQKGTIFYAESWALTDYLMFLSSDPGTRRGPIDHYLQFAAQGVDPVTAGSKAFGNLDQLQRNLQSFVQKLQFHYYRLKVSSSNDANAFQAQPLTPAESLAVRGGFLARVGRGARAQAMLEKALAEDPNLASANESMGLVAFEEHEPEAAENWFAKAARLSSQCYLARYHQALAWIQAGPNGAKAQQIVSNLEAFMAINPTYAPAPAALAFYYAHRSEHMDEAQQLAAKAVQLEPRNTDYRLLEASIFLKMGNPQGALRVAREAVDQAQTSAEKSRAYVLLGAIQEMMQVKQSR